MALRIAADNSTMVLCKIFMLLSFFDGRLTFSLLSIYSGASPLPRNHFDRLALRVASSFHHLRIKSKSTRQNYLYLAEHKNNASTVTMNTTEPPHKTTDDEQPVNDWVQRLIGFAAQCENEGILGLAQATVKQTTSITLKLATAVTSTACHIVSEAGRAVMQQHHLEEKEEEWYDLPLPHNATQVTREKKETPFLFKIAFQITDVMLASISPALSSNNSSIHSAYSYGIDSRLIEDDDIMVDTTSCSLNNEDFQDAHSCACDESSVYSVYFDANATVSTSCSESDETNDNGSIDRSSSDDTEESQSYIIDSLPNNMLYTTATTSSPTYFLDLSNDLLSKIDIDIPLMKGNNKKGDSFAFNSDANNETAVQAVLDALIRYSLELVADNNVSINWHPDDVTKRLLENYAATTSANTQWMQLLEREVLKWTTQVNNTPMLKTRGIVNMTPTELNDLLLDCTKVQQYNKCSLGKKDLCAFYPLCGGEVKIVEHIMQIPIVGGKVETLSLTHSRPLDNNSFVIVSRSVKKELNDDISNPCFSISSLRSIEGTNKTELTTLTSISSLPVPKFLIHRVAFHGADDFFCNLRKITF